jgi:hypothetical protein
MPEFNVRSDSVNVEQIMEQIRARIREKRGVDYTEEEIRELAAVKLEKFLDPRGVRSDLLDQFRKAMPAYEPPVLPNYSFESDTLFESHRGIIRFFRKLFHPLLKLFLFNPNPLIRALNIQARLNTMYADREAQRESSRRAMDQLYYELIHNLVVELTRTGIEVKNLKMRVESLASRLEFNERRARALESAVVYKPSDEEGPPRPAVAAPTPSAPPTPQPPASSPQPPHAQSGIPAEGPGQRSRRRRRRRGRRGGGAVAGQFGSPAATPQAGVGSTEASTGTASDFAAGDQGGAPASDATDHAAASASAASATDHGASARSAFASDDRADASARAAFADADPASAGQARTDGAGDVGSDDEGAPETGDGEPHGQ